MKKQFLLFLALIFVLPLIVQAHEEMEATGITDSFSPITSILYTCAIITAAVLISIIFSGKLTSRHKKILFAAIIIPVIFSTVYVAATTVYLNMVSESGGPVHWHADFEIQICGQKVLLKEPEGFDNKVGTSVLHHHNEGTDLDGRYRMHVEGVLVKKSEASLSHFFEKTGNLLQNDSIELFLKDGSQKRRSNGDACPNGNKGKLKVFVNEKEIQNFTDYVISPYSKVPPGDFIRIVFE